VIDMQPLANPSSTVSACGYDATERTLGIRFHSSQRVYLFAGVPAEIADGFRAAESPGKYFAAHIKGKFQPPEEGKKQES